MSNRWGNMKGVGICAVSPPAADTCTRPMAAVSLKYKRAPSVTIVPYLIDGNWKDVLSHLVPILNPPRLIVVSRRPDDELWTEVLNMGGFDLVTAPLQEV